MSELIVKHIPLATRKEEVRTHKTMRIGGAQKGMTKRKESNMQLASEQRARINYDQLLSVSFCRSLFQVDGNHEEIAPVTRVISSLLVGDVPSGLRPCLDESHRYEYECILKMQTCHMCVYVCNFNIYIYTYNYIHI